MCPNNETEETAARRERSMELMGWLEIQCVYCEQKSNLHDYHHMYRMAIKYQDGHTSPAYYLLRCPKCQKEMVLAAVEFKKLEEVTL